MHMDKTDLGNRMKEYEGIEANRILLPRLPICIRADGRAFHSFCKGLKRPFDPAFCSLMVDTTKFLVDKTNALIGYTFSDEISLVIYNTDINSEPFFNGRIQKLTSVIASMCTAFFNKSIPAMLPEKTNTLAFFDCRVWNVPNLDEAANTLVFRENDATKNSISMLAQSIFNHNELQNKNCSEMQDMLMEKGINWNDLPNYQKRGTYIQRCKIKRKFTSDEITELPLKHEARLNNDLFIERTEIKIIDLPKILSISNHVDVLFLGSDPIINK